jgi:hypothetical protein
MTKRTAAVIARTASVDDRSLTSLAKPIEPAYTGFAWQRRLDDVLRLRAAIHLEK